MCARVRFNFLFFKRRFLKSNIVVFFFILCYTFILTLFKLFQIIFIKSVFLQETVSHRVHRVFINFNVYFNLTF